MKKILLLILIFGYSLTALCQDSAKDTSKNACQSFTWVHEMPKFPGGDTALIQYIQDHINYKNINQEVVGNVYIRFAISEEGYVMCTKVLKGIGWGTDEEALRVIKELPRWTPGKQNGHPVSVWYTIPVHFK